METTSGANYGRNFEHQVVDGYQLLRQLGGSDHSLVFLTERQGDQQPQKAALKLFPVTSDDHAAAYLSSWEVAAAVPHPHLIQLFQWGRCRIAERPFVYIVMEYADEDLSQILPIRPLSADEVRQMLPPVIDVLNYLHGQGLVHGHLRPSNIMAVGDQIKISSDGLVQREQAGTVPQNPSLYSPPEAVSAGFSDAGDVWSLTATLVEILTQRPLERNGQEAIVPPGLPAPFSEIARHGLRPDPEQRWSLDQIAASLSAPPVSAPAAVVAPPRPIPTAPVANAPVPEHSSRRLGGIIAAAVALVIVLAAIAMIRQRHHAPEVQETSSNPSPAATPDRAAQPEPNQEPSRNSASGAQETARSTTPAALAPPSARPHHTNPAAEVVEQVLPDVPRGAKSTIRGTIRVDVRVAVDPSGKISDAGLLSRGSSRYFSNLALEASRKWKFTPEDTTSARSRTIRFEFRQNGTKASLLPARLKQ